MRRTVLTPTLDEAYQWRLLYESGWTVTRICRTFGRCRTTVDRALDWQGVERKRGRVVGEEEGAEIQRLYESGLSVRQVAEVIRRSPRTVGVVVRRRGCVRSQDCSMAEAREMRRLYVEERLTIAQVAARMKRGTTAVYACLDALDIRRRRSRITPDEMADMVAMYAERQSMMQIAERTGRSLATVSRTLNRAGVRINRRGRNIRPHPGRTPHEHVEAIIDTYRATRCQRATADALGISTSQVRYHLANAGEPLVPRGEIQARLKRLPAEREALICRLYVDGVPIPDIEREAGVVRATVTNVVRRNGIPYRPRSLAVSKSWAARREQAFATAA